MSNKIIKKKKTKQLTDLWVEIHRNKGGYERDSLPFATNNDFENVFNVWLR